MTITIHTSTFDNSSQYDRVDNMKELFLMGVGLIILVALLLGGVWFKATQEARTFNKFSPRDATTWDALWADLRVEACRQQ